MAGISSRHGGHHVAQKLMKTTFPLCSLRRNLPPCGVSRVKSSASLCCGGTDEVEIFDRLLDVGEVRGPIIDRRGCAPHDGQGYSCHEEERGEEDGETTARHCERSRPSAPRMCSLLARTL